MQNTSVLRHSRRGFALLMALGVLVILSLLASALLQTTTTDRQLARNFAYATQARLAAESGIDFCLAQIAALPGGPVPEALWRHWQTLCIPEPPLSDTADARSGRFPLAPHAGYAVEIHDESGKLNLNDPNPPAGDAGAARSRPGFAQGRLAGIVAGLAGIVLNDTARGEQVAETLFQHPQYGRAGYAGDRFPGMAAVRRALQAADLTVDEIAALEKHLTVYSWRDPNVLNAGGRVLGQPASRTLTGTDVNGTPLTRTVTALGFALNGEGSRLEDAVGMAVESRLAMQGADMSLEARAPVNVNTASPELLQALIQPLSGFYVEEGPGDAQSGEHYGWWSTGRGEPDMNVFRMGTLRRTVAFTPERAARLAKILHDRIHGTAWNPDIDNAWAAAWAGDVAWDDQQTDADGDGLPDPNPFETWEEFRHFLEHGIAGDNDAADGLVSGSAAHDIWLGDGFEHDMPLTPSAPAAFVDPHALLSPPFNSIEDEYRWRLYHRDYLPKVLPPASVPWDAARADRWWRGYYAARQIELLLANFNPNSLLNDFNPNANMHLAVDKNQLGISTTEFSFEPTGVWSIRSRGIVTAGAGASPLAAREIHAVMRLGAPLRLTSQAQFLRGLERTEDAAQYLSVPQTPRYQYQYHVTHASRPGSGGIRGTTLVAYPEPLAPGREAAALAADYDGALLFADLEWEQRTGMPDTQFVSFNGDSADWLAWDRAPWPSRQFAQQTGASGAPLTDTMPGNLRPDGVYCEKDRCFSMPMQGFITPYTAPSNLGFCSGPRGTLHFWLKPDFHPGIATRIRKFLAGPAQIGGLFARLQLPALYYLPNPASAATAPQPAGYDAPCTWWKNSLYHVQRGDWVPRHCLAFGLSWSVNQQYSYSANRRLGILRVVSNSLTNDTPWIPAESAPVSTWLNAHQWTHASVSYAFVNVLAWEFYPFKLVVNGVSYSHRNAAASTGYGAWVGNAFSQSPFRFPDVTDTSILAFGERFDDATGGIESPSPYAADATIDEIACNAEGPSGSSWKIPNEGAAWNRGRYFAGHCVDANADTAPRARYESPAWQLSLAAPELHGRVRLRSCAWTYYRARHNRRGTDAADNVRGMPVNPDDLRDPMIPCWHSRLSIQDLPTPEDWPEARQWDPLAVDILDEHGEWLSAATGASGLMTYPGGSRVADYDGHAERFRYVASAANFRFRCDFYLADQQKLYESPALDDITFFFELERPEILAWELKNT